MKAGWLAPENGSLGNCFRMDGGEMREDIWSLGGGNHRTVKGWEQTLTIQGIQKKVQFPEKGLTFICLFFFSGFETPCGPG